MAATTPTKKKKSKSSTKTGDQNNDSTADSAPIHQLFQFSEKLEQELGIHVGFSNELEEADETPSPKSRKRTADQSSKRSALHVTPYVTSAQVAILPDGIQQAFVDQTSEISLRTVSLLKQCLALQHSLQFPNRPPPTAALSLKDIEVNSKLPLNEQYIQLNLWNQITRLNLKSSKSLDTFLYQQKKKDSTNETAADETQRSANASKPMTFRDYYIGKLTSLFGDELDQLREEKSFDEKKLSLLVDCLESGVNLFAETDRQLHLTALSSKASSKNSAVHLSSATNASAVVNTEEES